MHNRHIKKVLVISMVTTLMHSLTLEAADSAETKDDFSYFSEQFADLKILRYNIPGFSNLTLQQKMLAYYLSKAALAGRDIYWDQNYRHNLTIRRILEQIMLKFTGDRNSDVFKKFQVYTKRVWFSNGIHHHYANDKFIPDFSQSEFRGLIAASPSGDYPLSNGEMLFQLIDRIIPIMFDPAIDKKKVCLDQHVDQVKSSAVNFYDGVSQAEVDEYYKAITVVGDATPISYGLNSKKVKKDGRVVEIPYKRNGLYHDSISEIITWLTLAARLAESNLQKQALLKLIEYYETGDLRKFDEYNILWVKDTDSVVDTINGFIEPYDDPMGKNGSWEAVVSIKDFDATDKFGKLSAHAQWFENNSPIRPEHKRSEVKGVSYKVINVVQEAGSSSPPTPIGINLPNADWIRENHGSKSVSLGNIQHAYSQSSKDSVLEEFFLLEEREWIKQYGDIAERIHTGLHEVVGHASGKLEPGVLPPHDTLKSYASTLEETRADLVGLYYIGDPYLVEIGVSPSADIIRASYCQYITNGMLKQLARVELGKNLEESHMRNRQLIASWVFEKSLKDNVIKQVKVEFPDGPKTYFVVLSFVKLRELFGELLREVQRIKSQGDYAAGMALVENYGVKIDPALHAEVKRRWAKLNIAPYAGFINPELRPVIAGGDGEIVDIVPHYPADFTEQMLSYAKNHSTLEHYPQ